MSECLGSRPAWPYLFARTAWCLGLSSFVFRLFIFSSAVFSLFLCALLGACLLPHHLRFRGKLSRCWVLLLFSSYSFCSCSVVFVLWKILRLSRQAVKLRLLERLDELGWATTCRCDILAQWTESNQLQARFAFLFSSCSLGRRRTSVRFFSPFRPCDCVVFSFVTWRQDRWWCLKHSPGSQGRGTGTPMNNILSSAPSRTVGMPIAEHNFLASG